MTDPLAALKEMRRVTRPGAPVLAWPNQITAAASTYPPGLAEIGQKQAEALRAQGAEPEIGRRLIDLFQVRRSAAIPRRRSWAGSGANNAPLK